jgi:hypothetical protein
VLSFDPVTAMLMSCLCPIFGKKVCYKCLRKLTGLSPHGPFGRRHASDVYSASWEIMSLLLDHSQMLLREIRMDVALTLMILALDSMLVLILTSGSLLANWNGIRDHNFCLFSASNSISTLFMQLSPKSFFYLPAIYFKIISNANSTSHY